MKMIFRILFLTLSNININFINKKLKQYLYIIVKVMLIIKKIELIKNKKFIVIVFNVNNKIFLIYIIFFCFDFNIYSFYKV